MPPRKYSKKLTLGTAAQQKYFLGAEARRQAARKRMIASERGHYRISGYYGRFVGTNAEKKFFDTVKAATSVDAAGTVLDTSINLIPQGITEKTRIGRKCVIKNINIKGSCILPAATSGANTTDIIRFALIQDKQCNGTAATIALVYEDTSFTSFLNLANSGRFRILKQFTRAVTSPGGSGRGSTDTLDYGRRVSPFNMNLSVNIPLEFNNTTGAITEIRSNNMAIMAFSQAGLMDVLYRVRVRFTDGS